MMYRSREKVENLRGPVGGMGLFFSGVLYVRCVRAARASTALHSIRKEMPWNSHRFHIKRFFRESEMKIARVHEYRKVYLVVKFCKETTCSSQTSAQ